MNRNALLGGVSLAAILAAAATPAQAGGPVFRTLSQSLATRAAAYATSAGGSAASTQAGRQAAQGIEDLTAAAARFRTLQEALAASATSADAGGNVPNGLTAGGLVPETGYNQPGTGVWQGVSATAPVTQTNANGIDTVTINQAAPQAILNWTSFNVGSHTKVIFNQSAGGVASSGWTVLNRVEDPSATPSQIFGTITAQGQVLIINRNGVLFGAGAQVSLHSLVAGAVAISDSAFLNTGFIAPANSVGPSPVFISAGGAVTVAAGAVIAADAPASPTEGGGSVILLGQSVENDGLISTPDGQTILAGGQNFVLRAGYSMPPGGAAPAVGTCPTESACSTVLGAEVEAIGKGSATNTGLIVATTGDITMAGQTILQSGGLFATTAVNQRGTVHLLSDVTNTNGMFALDPNATITLESGGVIAITPDPNSASASDTQRRDTVQIAYGGENTLPDQAPLPDQPDRSRVEITTAGTVVFAPDSLVLATGGQIAVSASNGTATNTNGIVSGTMVQGPGEVFLASGATLDVSGLNNVVLPMSTNEIAVDVQGFQLRDSPVNRDTGDLFDSTIELDARNLAYVPPSTVDGQARDYTPGGLFEVSAEIAGQLRTIDEWSAVGGTVTLAAAAVVAQPRATVNIAGGSLDYQSGFFRQSYLIGPGGILYNAATAPGNLLYSGLYDGFTIDHARWRKVERYINPLLYPTEQYEPGYRIGRDAGELALETPTAVFDATIDGGVETDPAQIAARNGSVTDPVLLAQDVVPLAGTLSLRGAPSPTGSLTISPTLVTIAVAKPTSAASLDPDGRVPLQDIDTAVFTAAQLNGLGGVSIVVGPTTPENASNAGAIMVDGGITLAQGGNVTLAAPIVTVDAGITARGGAVTIETENPVTNLGTLQAFSTLQRGTIAVAAGVLIDTRGDFTNAIAGVPDPSGAAYINGGNVTLLSDGGLRTGAGSLIDASAGAVYDGILAGGHGGDITLIADDPTLITPFTGSGATLSAMELGGTMRSLGVTAGGTFSLAAPAISIGNDAAAGTTLPLVTLPAGFFASGFSDYVLNGFATPSLIPNNQAQDDAEGVVVQPGTSLRLVEPVLTVGAATMADASGSDPETALSATVLPEFVLDAGTASVRQRPGASLTLSSTFGIPGNAAFLFPEQGSGITVGQGATITVDAGQSVTLTSPSQMTMNGTIRAPSGTIALENPAQDTNGINPVGFGTSIWIGPQAVLDVSGQAITGTTDAGRPFGVVTGGGWILVGASGDVNSIDNFASAAAYVFVRPGAQLLADGAMAVLDPFAGTKDISAPREVASSGGTIAFASDFGIYLDGTMNANAGDAGAPGGELAIRLGDPGYGSVNGTMTYPDWAFTPHQIIVSQTTNETVLPADLVPGSSEFAEHDGANGQAAISAQQVSEGGFADLFLLARDQITFNGNVSLAAGQSITLADFATSETSATAAVQVTAPYILLAGAPAPYLGNAQASPLLTYAPGSGGGQGNGGQPFSKIEPCISGVSACDGSTLEMSADLIDIQSSATNVFGANALLNGVTFNGATANFTGETASAPLDAFGFNAVTLRSAGDIRFVAAPSTPSPLPGSGAEGLSLLTDTVSVEGDLTLEAAQIYPVTGVEAVVGAGVNYWGLFDGWQGNLANNGLYYGGVLTIGRTTQIAPAAPYSVYGRIGFDAATIEQGGVVEAPLGVIGFGGNSAITASIGVSGASVGTVDLLPGSDTSVSANGLVVPFGGTTDGTSFRFNGQVLTPQAASLGLVGNQSATIFFTAGSIAGAGGSVLDLSGGGTLAGGGGELLSGGTTLVSQGFTPGRGGSADTLVTPFLVAAGGAVTQPTIATDPIYAILPGNGSSYAPTSAFDTSSSTYGSQPGIGAQVTITAGLPGLPAGVYTLLPSYYALLPGAFRIQLNTPGAIAGSLTAPALMQSAIGVGTVAESVTLGIAGTGVTSYPILADITTGAGVRDFSTYDEQGFTGFATQNAALFGNARPFLPQDAGDIVVTLSEPTQQVKDNGQPTMVSPGFTFDGTARDAAAPGGYGPVVVVQPVSGGDLDIIGPGDATPPGVASAEAASLDALNPGAILIGDGLHFTAGFPTAPSSGGAGTVTIGSSAVIDADTIFVIGAHKVSVDAGATLSTLGQTASVPDSSSGELFSPGNDAMVALSNQQFLISASETGTAAVQIGGCTAGAACANALLASNNFVGLFTPKTLTIGQDVDFGAPTLTLGSSTITLLGEDASGATPNGLVLDQATIDALLDGGQGKGVPAVTSLQLDAGVALVLNGDVSLDLAGLITNTLVLTTPAILGLGTAADTATIADSTVVWTGVSGAETAVPEENGPGTGLGKLVISANSLVLGYAAETQSQDQTALSDTVLGFSTVALNGASSVSGNNRSALTVYQTETTNGTVVTGSGGNLTVNTPLLTTASGAVLAMTAGGGVTLAGAAASPGAAGGLGGEIDIAAASLDDDTTVALPGGRFAVTTSGGIALGPDGALDLGGPVMGIFSATRGVPGGTALLTSLAGGIDLAAGSRIDVSSVDAAAGTINLAAPQGVVTLEGMLLGGAPQAAESGSVAITGTTLGDFTALNGVLDAGGFLRSRTFEQTGPGDLTVAGTLTAQTISIAVDQGALTIAGELDASGTVPGTIRLAASGDLTLGSSAVLDLHDTGLHTDYFGNPIDAENTPFAELTVASNVADPGTLTLSPGASILMAGPGGLALGDLELDVPRSADNTNANIAASGPVTVTGAATIAVNAFRTYLPGETVAGDMLSGTLTQADFGAINVDSQAFMAAVVSNGKLVGPLAGELDGLVGAYATAFHLRPGVEIDSNAASLNDLTVSGEIDLSEYRYGSVNASTQLNQAIYGSGEPGVLWLRAADDLTIAGSITDGFLPNGTITLKVGKGSHQHLETITSASLAPMLDAGDLSWSMRLVAGAALEAADSRTVQSETALMAEATAFDPTPGNLLLSDAHKLAQHVPGEDISFLRTGTGFIDLLAGGNFTEESAFGIYTAGTQAAGAPNAPDHFVTTGGGNVTLAAGGNASGYVFETKNGDSSDQMSIWLQHDSTSWWLDFASYSVKYGVTGFTGIGALAGGNVTVTVGGDAGTGLGESKSTSTGLQIVDTTTGYQEADGAQMVFGGGDVSINVGQAFDPGGTLGNFGSDDAFGVIADLRGALSLSAGSIGQILPTYSPLTADPRAYDPFVAESAFSNAGPVLVLGDTQANLSARGDLALSGVSGEVDYPTKSTKLNFDFSFYQPSSSLALFSAGGNVDPVGDNPGSNDPVFGVDAIQYQTMYYPGRLDITAASGNVYLLGNSGTIDNLELAPSPLGSLAVLAGGSIYDGQTDVTSQLDIHPEALHIEMSGASPGTPSPLPGAIIENGILNGAVVDSASGTLHAGDDTASLFYALNGDIVGLQTGAMTTTNASSGNPAYIGATAVQIEAGRDVVAIGGVSYLISSDGTQMAGGAPPNLFLNNNVTDISVIEAGRDIIYANADIAGPGSLIVEAGRNVYQGDQGVLDSVGEIGSALTVATRDSGAGITVLAGLNGGTDLDGFARLYLDPSNLANGTTPLQDQPGKVVRTYQTELYAWLQLRGYQGDPDGALAYFLTLPDAVRTSFLLTVYFAELSQSGLDYNNPASRFYHSYLEGQDAIRALFPETDATGRAAPDGGNLTLFSGETFQRGVDASQLATNLYDSAIRTDFGGGITLVVPYGQTLLGNYGIVPQASAGVLTQGSGNIDMYSYGSVTLGQSRVLTTFGGDILIWMSSDGEINAGRGAKNTILIPPIGISYDEYGNIELSPTTPAAGAGIATLAPIPSVAAGDINLIAPFGTIDAGEAGIRSSGNVNVAAFTVVNGANISSSGKTTGVPTVNAPSASAVAAASATAGSSVAASQATQPRPVPAEDPSIVDVEILSIGGGDNADQRKKRGA